MKEHNIAKVLRKMFPYGHPRFIPLQLEKMELHSNKNLGFACKGDSLGNFNRVSAIKQLYPGFDWTTPQGTAMDYHLKQYDSFMIQKATGIIDKVEPPIKRLRDMSVYTDIMAIMEEE